MQLSRFEILTVFFIVFFIKLEAQKHACQRKENGLNEKVFLGNQKSILKSIGSLKGIYDYQTESVYLSNKSMTQYLVLHQELGGPSLAFDRLKVGYVGRDKWRFSWTNFEIFKSNSGCFLGMGVDSFLKLYPAPLSLKKTEIDGLTVLYEYNCESELYFSKYLFRDNLLVEYEFGYLTP